MLLESLVAIMAMIAAALLDPGVYFAINSPLAALGGAPEAAVATLSGWGFPVTVAQMNALARQVGEQTLFARTGGAPSLAVGMASILRGVFGSTLIAIWYHFAIMFEAVFILTTLDAGTRVGRFMLQDALGNLWRPLGRTSWYPSVILSSALVVAAWGYFLYVGRHRPVRRHQHPLAALRHLEPDARRHRARGRAPRSSSSAGEPAHAWITALPLAWLAIVTTTAAWEKLFSANPKIGFFAGAADLAAKLAAGASAREGRGGREADLQSATRCGAHGVLPVRALGGHRSTCSGSPGGARTARRCPPPRRRATSAPASWKARMPNAAVRRVRAVAGVLGDVIRGAAGTDAYRHYLAHHQRHHRDREPLSREAFFRRELSAKWEGIRRCC